MSFRETLTPAQRATPLNHVIDPGFVHRRKIQSIIGKVGMDVIDQAIGKIPPLQDWERGNRIDYIYTELMLTFCNKLQVPSLGQLVEAQKGTMFCSTEKLGPCPDVYSRDRAVSVWVPPGQAPEFRVELHYSTEHISSTTMKERLAKGGHPISIIAQFHSKEKDRIIFEPLIIGFPWLQAGDAFPDFDIMWFGANFYENYVEDFDEFQQVLSVPTPKSPVPMERISESAFKMCLAEILGDSPQKDWGGETSDYYTAHIHLNGRRHKAAFLLKGPASFRPMTLNHLGKNNDQIVRLAREPAEILVVQHSHDISTPVRDTLRAFAVQPSNARRYCCMDGRDSLRLLQAYGLYEKAANMNG